MRRDEKKLPLVAEIVNRSEAGSLSTRTLPPLAIDSVTLNQFHINRLRILSIRDSPGHVEVVTRVYVSNQLLDETVDTDRDVAVLPSRHYCSDALIPDKKMRSLFVAQISSKSQSSLDRNP